MGSFNVTCALTGCSIHENDKCFYIPITPVKSITGSLCYIYDLYTPLSLPIYGTYNDYGRLLINETPGVKRLKEFYTLEDDDIFDEDDWNRPPENIEKKLKIETSFKKFNFFILEEAVNYLFENLITDCGTPISITPEELWDRAKKDWESSYGTTFERYTDLVAKQDGEGFSNLLKRELERDRLLPYTGRNIPLLDLLRNKEADLTIYKDEIINALKIATVMSNFTVPFMPLLLGWQCGNPYADKKRAIIIESIASKKLDEYD